MIKIESLGSFWWIDERNKLYCRTPKIERPREDPINGRGTPLEDLKWQSFTRLELMSIDRSNFWARKYRKSIVGVLRIHYDGDMRSTPLGLGSWVHAPLTPEQFTFAQEVLSEK